MHYENFRRPVWTISVTGLAQVMAGIDRFKAGLRHPLRAADAAGLAPGTTVAEAQAWDELIAAAPPDQPQHQRAWGRPKTLGRAARKCVNLGGHYGKGRPWRPGDPRP